jgi:nicotinate phosphoribosyltransferase
MGTMAHSLVQNYEDEKEAFLTYAKSNPNNCLFLVDTYDTLRSGIPNAIWVADNYLKPRGLEFKGIRIDSGDLAYLSKEARRMLDDAGYPNAKICLSNGLDEDTIISLERQGACFDSIGLGDNISAINDRVNGVYKLSAVTKEGVLEPRIKLSNDSIKTTNPGYKKVYRFYDKETGYALADVISLASEIIPDNEYTLIDSVDEWKQKTISNYDVEELQVPVFIDGELVYEEPTILERQNRVKAQMKSLYPEIKRLENPQEYIVDLSEALLKLKRQMIFEHKCNNTKGKGLVKVDNV